MPQSTVAQILGKWGTGTKHTDVYIKSGGDRCCEKILDCPEDSFISSKLQLAIIRIQYSLFMA